MRPEQKRKSREAPPPGKYARSRGGTAAEIVRTSRLSPDGRWLYRLWYGEVLGSREWTLAELEALGLRWMTRRPSGLRPRREAQESAPAAQAAG